MDREALQWSLLYLQAGCLSLLEESTSNWYVCVHVCVCARECVHVLQTQTTPKECFRCHFNTVTFKAVPQTSIYKWYHFTADNLKYSCNEIRLLQNISDFIICC